MQTIRGTVVEGKQEGKALGFPTANIPLTGTTLSGIYAGRVQVDESVYGAALYADPVRGVLEAHLLDFAGDLYGKSIAVEVLAKIRDSSAFENVEVLKAAIAHDIEMIREYLSHNQ
jgi:riboflavin kinase/FMN adenylyltransferase